MTALIILIAGLAAGFMLRMRYLRLPLDWDHGLLLYQSYWYNRTRCFIVDIVESTSESRGWLIGETDMVRAQSLAHSFIFILLEALCKDRVWAYRLFDAVYSLAISLTLFGLGSFLFDPVSAALGAALFSVFSCMPFFWGAMDNTEKFQVLFTFSGILGIVASLYTSNYLFCIPAGILFFIAMIFKQNVGFVILGSLLFLVTKGAFMAVLIVLTSILTCYLGVFINYMRKGYSFMNVFGRFFISRDYFFYLYNYRVDKTGKTIKQKGPGLFSRMKPNLKKVMGESSLLWFASFVWFMTCAIHRYDSPVFHLFVLLLAGTALAFFAANKYFPYYYMPFLPILAMTSGNLFATIYGTYPPASIPWIGLTSAGVGCLALSIHATYGFFFRSTPFEQGAYMYGNTLYNFGVSEEIGLYIRSHTQPNDYIYVYNLNPEIYFFSQRKSATDSLYIDNLSTASYTQEDQKQLERIMREKLKAASPAYIVINKATGVPIGFFESVTGNDYFLEKEYHAGFSAQKDPVYLQMFKIRKVHEACKLISEGEALFGQDRLDEAIAAFMQANALDPLNGDALNNLGVCLYRRHDLEKAVEYFVMALQANPSNRDVVLNLMDMDLPVQDKYKVLQIYLSNNPNDAEIRQVSIGLKDSLGTQEAT